MANISTFQFYDNRTNTNFGNNPISPGSRFHHAIIDTNSFVLCAALICECYRFPLFAYRNFAVSYLLDARMKGSTSH
jgi:hypothetical protein